MVAVEEIGTDFKLISKLESNAEHYGAAVSFWWNGGSKHQEFKPVSKYRTEKKSRKETVLTSTSE